MVEIRSQEPVVEHTDNDYMLTGDDLDNDPHGFKYDAQNCEDESESVTSD